MEPFCQSEGQHEASGDAERQRFVAETWPVLQAARPLTSSADQARLGILLDHLAYLQARPFLHLWQTTVPAPAAAMSLIDIDGNHQEELLLVDRQGGVYCYQVTEPGRWELLAQTRLPIDAGPVVDLETFDSPYEEIELAHVVTRDATGESGDRLYEVLLDAQSKEMHLNLRPMRHPVKRLAISQRFGPPGVGSPTTLYAAYSQEDGHPELVMARGNRLCSLPFNPTAMVHAGPFLWLADSQERLWCWQWDGRRYHAEPAWPPTGVDVDGRVTAMALWPQGEYWLLLVATDERWLFIVDRRGQVQAQLPGAQSISAMTVASDGEQPLLWLANETGLLCLLQAIWPPLAQEPWPTFAEAFASLPDNLRDERLQRWLTSNDRQKTAAAAAALAVDLATGQPRAREILHQVHTGQEDEAVVAILDVLEPPALAAGRVDDSLVNASFELARTLYPKAKYRLRSRINLLVARLAATLQAEVLSNKDYRWLSDARRHEELAQAREYIEQARRADNQPAAVRALENAVELNARTLIQRRQTAWLFATTSTIRTVKPLAASGHVLLTTRSGLVDLIDLERRRLVASYQLPAGTIPASVTIYGRTGENGWRLALVTSDGQLLLGSIHPEQGLQDLAAVKRVAGSAWSLAHVPAEDHSPTRLIISSDEGRLLAYHYHLASNTWQAQPAMQLPAVSIRTLFVDNLTRSEPAILLAGGTLSDGRGVVYLLDSDGQERYQALHFPGSVLDVRTATWPTDGQKVIAVACADGCLYLMHPSGARLWHYHVGRAARSLAVCDLDNDGRDEIIVGGETVDSNMVLVLDVEGAVQWHIPTRAPVTHVATAGEDVDGLIHLLIADLERNLQVVTVFPPGSREEESVQSEAAACFQELASRLDTKPRELAARWIRQAPSTLLCGYAFYACSAYAREGDTEALDLLLQANVAQAEPLLQRAYARALVNVATLEGATPTMAGAVVGRLETLLADKQTRLHAGTATLHKLMLPGRLNTHPVSLWLPLLQEAGRHPRAEVQRAVLFALRALGPGADTSFDLKQEVWAVLNEVVCSPSSDEQWVLDDLAGLLRDQAGSDYGLWILAHRVLARLAAARVLAVLGQTQPPLLHSTDLAEAIQALASLSQAGEPEIAGETLRQLVTALDKANIRPGDGHDLRGLLEIYHLAGQAVQLRDRVSWEQFVTDRVMAGGLDRLLELLVDAGEEAEPRLAEQCRQVRAAISEFRQAPPGAETLGRLNEALKRTAERLVRSSISSATDDPLSPVMPLSGLLAGVLWHWYDGLLAEWLEDLARPVEPQVDVTLADLRPDELLLHIRLWNPGETGSFEEINVRVREASVRYDNLRLLSQPEANMNVERFILDPKEQRSSRLHFFLEEGQREVLGAAARRGQEAELRLPIRYLRPPTHWAYTELTTRFVIHHSARVGVNYVQELPYAWRYVQQQLNHTLRRRDPDPILLECTRFARKSLMQAVQDYPRREPRPPIIDLRQWLYDHQTFEDNRLQTDEATLLHWFARRLWPKAAHLSGVLEAGIISRHAFREFARAQNTPEIVILNNLERFLFSLSQRDQETHALDDALLFLLSWATENNIRIVFMGTYLAEKIAVQRWPELAKRVAIIRCDHLDIGQPGVRADVEAVVERLLHEEELDQVLAGFPESPTAGDLVTVCGGYLHYLELVALPALREIREEPPTHLPTLDRFLTEYAQKTNFFNALWMWQPFAERAAALLVAHGEIPLQERTWAEAGMTLSRDYYARRPDGRPVPLPTLPAGRQLNRKDVQRIRSNEYYRSGDAWVRGFAPRRPISQEMGQEGALLLAFLRANDEQALLDGLVDAHLLRRQRTRHLGTYFEIAVPLYGQWLRRAEIWTQLTLSMQNVEQPWYPQELSWDQRTDSGHTQRLLFPGRQAGSAYRDIPFTQLPAIAQRLDRQTESLFLNLYGLSSRGEQSAGERWSLLVRLAETLNKWLVQTNEIDGGLDTAHNLFTDLQALLDFRLLNTPYPPAVATQMQQGRLSQRIKLESLPSASAQQAPWAYVEFTHTAHALRKQVIFLVIRDGATAAQQGTNLYTWARDRLDALYRQLEEGLPETEYIEARERSVVIVLALHGGDELRRALPPGRGGPHFIVLNLEQFTDILVQPDPLDALINYAFSVTGRHSFTPYKLFGSLVPGSSLFVGRTGELQSILGSLDRENHAILGSRRIGKTSLLQEIAHRLRQSEHGRRTLALLLRLQDNSKDTDLYTQIGWALEAAGHRELAAYLAKGPGGAYNELYDVMSSLYKIYRHPIVLLIDEIDGLYLWDRHHNNERLFQFLRNNLTQSSPRLCTMVMTGFRHVYLHRLQYGSVFYNFCRFHNLAGVEPGAVRQLVRLLRDFNIKLEDERDMIALITRGTYAIPYYVQRVCDRLLGRVDHLNTNRLGPADAQAVLERDLQTLLKRELWDDLNVDPLLNMTGESQAEDRVMQTIYAKTLLLATVVTHYQTKFEARYSQATLDDVERTFTASQALRYLNELYPNLWSVTEAEADRLLRSLTMTLTLAPAESEHWAYEFPADILPQVLFFHHHQGSVDLLEELDNLAQLIRSRGGASR